MARRRPSRSPVPETETDEHTHTRTYIYIYTRRDAALEKRAKRRGHLRSVSAAIARGATRGGYERERERKGRENRRK